MNIKLWVILYILSSFQFNVNASELNSFVIDHIHKKVIPGIEKLNVNTINFKQSVDEYCPHQNDDQLNQLKNKWIKAYLSWKEIQLYGFGSTGYLRVQRHLDFWPTRKSKLQKLLLQPNTEKAFINSGVSTRGFPAIEWLLFENPDKSKNYCALLQLLTSDLLEKIHSLHLSWQETAVSINNKSEYLFENYIYSAKPAEEFINAIVVGTYLVRKKSLITPMGLTTGFIDKNRMEANFSALSKEVFKIRLKSIIDLFSDEKIGLIEWLNINNYTSLADMLTRKVAPINEKYQSLDDEFSIMIESKDKRLIELESDMNDLQFILEQDLSDAFNLIMFFKDLDGD